MTFLERVFDKQLKCTLSCWNQAALLATSPQVSCFGHHVSIYPMPSASTRNPDVGAFILRQCINSPASLTHVVAAAREQLSVSARRGSRPRPGLLCVEHEGEKRERKRSQGEGPTNRQVPSLWAKDLEIPYFAGIEQWKCNVMSPVGFRSWRSQIVTLAVARGACQAHTGLREIDEADLKPLGVGKMLVVKAAIKGLPAEPWWANDTYCCQYAAFAMRRVWLALILVNNQINIM